MKKITKKSERSNRPEKLSDSLNKINKKILNKYGKINFTLRLKWEKIVGSFFANHSEPLKITSIPIISEKNNDNTLERLLEVNVSPGIATEFQHFKNKIIEKINSHFGYKVIDRIKITQKYISKENINPYKSKTEIDKKFLNRKKVEIKDTTQKINDKELKKSLLNLGLSIEKFKEN